MATLKLLKGKEWAMLLSKSNKGILEFIPTVLQSLEREYGYMWQDTETIISDSELIGEIEFKSEGDPADVEQVPIENNDCIDFSRESLNTYINKFGNITDQEFVVLATYFAESKDGGIISITSETVKQYYEEARKSKYSNPSQLLTELVKKNFQQRSIRLMVFLREIKNGLLIQIMCLTKNL